MLHKYPFVPLKNIVVFPNIIIPIFIGRSKSVNAIEFAKEKNKKLVLTLQKVSVDDPSYEQIHDVGVIADVVQISKIDSLTYKILINAQERVRIVSLISEKNYGQAQVEPYLEIDDFSSKQEKNSLIKIIYERLELYLSLNKIIPSTIIKEVLNTKDIGKFIYSIAHFMMFSMSEKQQLLNMSGSKERAQAMVELLTKEIDIIRVEEKLNSTVKVKIEKSQKEFYLKEKMKAIKAELGETIEFDEISDYVERINNSDMPEEIREKTLREISKLRKSPSISAEAGIIKTYLEWLLDLPWNKEKQSFIEMDQIHFLLNERHYGLEKIKERITEFLAVYKLTNNIQGSILCLAGPSGVGKTSIAKSIAQVMGRQFITIALGGMNDEGELRGHRRTYVGAMPGRIIQALRTAKVRNPVILLDEMDKMTKNFQSNPAAVLLEILDKEQNKNFYDYYLEVSVDLSEVLFIATANNIADIPSPLLDRMEVINLSGYNLEEKLVIARKYILPKVILAHGLSQNQLEIEEEALRGIILYYTREAGLRELERCLATLARKAALLILQKSKGLQVSAGSLAEFLGIQKYKHKLLPDCPVVGVSQGMAYTSSGGEIMPVEVSVFAGKGILKLTGKMGDVMQESSQTALSYVRFIAKDLGLSKDYFEKTDVHIHIPENAIPKDGPSAGVAITIALISAYTKIPIRNDIAMTGEISLHGQVLPVGGIREKLLAAENNNIKEIFVPIDNLPEVEEVEKQFKQKIYVQGIRNVSEIIGRALVRSPVGKKTKKKWLDK